ncbi:MAG: low-specificity L-threonine aldolase [Candidatus Promineifilaceae bacterium]
MDRIDFRSDTVTWPTPSMRQAMATASVGDDVYGEDPTVNKLEALAATKTGTEAALFVSSGTMGNLTAIMSHTSRGDEAILGSDSHVMVAEAGGMCSLGGIMPRPIPTDCKGRMSIEDIKAAINPDDPHYAKTRLILVENTYGNKNGFPIPTSYFTQISSIAREHGLSVHMDGARLFNAAVALNRDVKEMAQHVDSVTFCLSKGLCAPVGSLLCGTASFIKRARYVRKALGGGMRQAGILAAAGIVALEEMIDRLAVDHANAHLLAVGLDEIPGIELDVDLIQTNIVFFGLSQEVDIDADRLARAVREEADIWLDVVSDRLIRAVTHHWIGESEVYLLLNHLRAKVRI